MKRPSAILLAAMLAVGAAQTPAKQAPATELPLEVREAQFPVTAEELIGHVAFLAHDRLRGRAAGSVEDCVEK